MDQPLNKRKRKLECGESLQAEKVNVSQLNADGHLTTAVHQSDGTTSQSRIAIDAQNQGSFNVSSVVALGSSIAGDSKSTSSMEIEAVGNTPQSVTQQRTNSQQVSASDKAKHLCVRVDKINYAIAKRLKDWLSTYLEYFDKTIESSYWKLTDILKSKGSHGATAVYVAAKFGNISALELLIKYGADVNIPNSSGVTPLYIAGHYGNVRAVSILCAAGADIDRAKADGATVTYSACKHGHLAVVKQLVKYGATAQSSRKSNGMTLLHVASQNGFIDVVRYLIDVLKANTNQRTVTGGTALHLACFRDKLEVVKLLIARGADVDIKDDAGGWTALHIASQVGNLEIVKAVLHAPTNGHKNPFGKTDAFESQMNSAVSYRLRRPKDDDYSALMVSCRTGNNLELTKYLINQGADLEQQLHDETTPFLIAAKHGRFSHVEYFLSLPPLPSGKRIVDQVSLHLWTALHWAARGGFVEMTELLVSIGLIDINKKVRSGMTALYIASHHGHIDVVKVLIKYGADVNIGMINGASPLYTACKHGQLEVAKVLVANGADIGATNSRGSSPLHTACNHDHFELVKFLVNEAGADPSSTKGQEGWMALHIACRVGALKIVKFLVEDCNVDITIRTEGYNGFMGGFSPLHLAASHGRIEIVRYLVGYVNAEIDIKSSTGMTPVELAEKKQHYNVKNWLLRARQWTPLMFAVDARDETKIKRILRGEYSGYVANPCFVTEEFKDSAMSLALLDNSTDETLNTKRSTTDATEGNDANTMWLPVSESVVNIVRLSTLEYGPKTHFLYPKCVQRAVFTALCINQRRKVLPKDVWLHIFSFLGRNYLSTDANCFNKV